MVDCWRSCSMALCCALFCLLYILQKITPPLSQLWDARGEYGLLLFMVPGIVSSHLTKSYRMLSTLVSAVIASGVCLFYQRFFVSNPAGLWHDTAYAASAVLWCIFGAAAYVFVYFMLEKTKVQQ